MPRERWLAVSGGEDFQDHSYASRFRETTFQIGEMTVLHAHYDVRTFAE